MQRRKLVENKWVTFIEDKFQLPNGANCTYYHAQKSDAVMTIAVEGVNTDGFTYIVNQHRHPIGKSIWQFPIGGFDPTKEDPVDAARKELREETGIVAGSLEYLGSFYVDPGFTNQKLHVCATKDIREVREQNLESSEFGLICKKIPIANIGAMIKSGEMGDAWGITGHFYLHSFLS